MQERSPAAGGPWVCCIAPAKTAPAQPAQRAETICESRGPHFFATGRDSIRECPVDVGSSHSHCREAGRRRAYNPAMTANPHELTTLVKTWARECGFDL